MDARFCYLIVLVCALLAAYRQVDRRLATFPGSWTEAATWLLYSIYVLVPLALFWLLDRTGAINDTSVIAAGVVGVGYERILSGQEGPKLPGVLAGFWTPFVAFADSISARVSKRIADRLFRFDRRLIEKITASKETFEAIKKLARSLTRDVESLDKKIADIEAKRPALGDQLTQEKQVVVLYAEVSQVSRWLDLLREAGVIDEAIYKTYPSDTRIVSRIFEFGLPLLLILAYLLSSKGLDQQFYLWRLAKGNATMTDQWRTQENLTAYVGNHATTTTMSKRIARITRNPAIHPSRVEIALQTMIAGSKRVNRIPPAAIELVWSLRTQSADNRTRIQSALLHLAKVHTGADLCSTTSPVTLPDDVCAWKPTDGDSIVDIEDRIDRWAAFWSKYLPPSGTDNAVVYVK